MSTRAAHSSPPGVRPTPRLSAHLANLVDGRSVFTTVVKFLLWCILFVLCWPLALLALVVYPIVWIVLIPFRLLGIAVEGVLGLFRGIIMLPVRLVGGPEAH